MSKNTKPIGKKRKLKKSKTWAVSALIDLIPFLNAKDNFLPLAIAWVKKWAKPPANIGGWMPERGLNEKDVSKHHDLLQTGLKFCYGVMPSKDLNELLEKLNENFSDAENSLNFEVIFMPSFEEKKLKSCLPITTWKPVEKSNSPFYGLSAKVITLSLGGNINDRESVAPGKDWVGRCPKCEKMFEKVQANAEYCSNYCIGAVFRTTKKK